MAPVIMAAVAAAAAAAGAIVPTQAPSWKAASALLLSGQPVAESMSPTAAHAQPQSFFAGPAEGPVPLLQGALSLAVVVGLIALAGLAARRHWPAAGMAEAGALRLRATLAVDARRRLHLVDTPHGAALILTGGAGDCIAVLPAADRPA